MVYVLYKYLSSARIDVLQNLKIRFTQPCELNDPFESALLVQSNAFQDWEAQMLKDAEQFVPETEEERAELEEIKEELRQNARMMTSPQAVGRELADRINRAQGVLSLSRTNDSLLMWAHYGESHKGYVLGLDDSHPWFYERNGLGEATKPHNVIYTSRRSAIKAGSEDFYDGLLCFKSLEWAYEEEVRIFRTFGANQERFDQNNLNDVHLFNIPKECIKEIFIGANAISDSNFVDKIFHEVWRSQLDVKIYVAYVDEEKYALNFHPIEDHWPT